MASNQILVTDRVMSPRKYNLRTQSPLFETVFVAVICSWWNHTWEISSIWPDGITFALTSFFQTMLFLRGVCQDYIGKFLVPWMQVDLPRWLVSPRFVGKWSNLTTLPKFNSSPLKSYYFPIGKDESLPTINFQGRAVKLRRCNIFFRWVGSTTNSPGYLLKKMSQGWSMRHPWRILWVQIIPFLWVYLGGRWSLDMLVVICGCSYCWWFRNPANQLIWRMSHFFKGFNRYCNGWCRISSTVWWLFSKIVRVGCTHNDLVTLGRKVSKCSLLTYHSMAEAARCIRFSQDCFPSYPKDRCVFSRIGVNQKTFCNKGSTVATDLVKHLQEEVRVSATNKGSDGFGEYALKPMEVSVLASKFGKGSDLQNCILTEVYVRSQQGFCGFLSKEHGTFKQNMIHNSNEHQMSNEKKRLFRVQGMKSYPIMWGLQYHEIRIPMGQLVFNEPKWENMGHHRDSRKKILTKIQQPVKWMIILQVCNVLSEVCFLLWKSLKVVSRFKTRMTPEFIEFVLNAPSKVMTVFLTL